MPWLIKHLLWLLVVCSLSVSAAEPPRVVVSVAPIHSLAAGVMAGVTEPLLLVQANTDPHTYALKPSQMSALQKADLIVWAGESVESYLPKALFAIGKRSKVIKLTALPRMKLLPSRKGGMWEAHAEAHEDHHRHDEYKDIDGHLWLDIGNAKEIVNALVAALGDLDSRHATQYQRNGRQMLQRLDALDRELHGTLTPVSTKPYMVFHDAYHYFETRYRLNAVGAISVDPERKPGARRLSEVRRKIEEHQIVCVFSQPQFPNVMVKLLVEGTAVRNAQLDDLGGGFQPGAELYFNLMQTLAVNLKQCLA